MLFSASHTDTTALKAVSLMNPHSRQGSLQSIPNHGAKAGPWVPEKCPGHLGACGPWTLTRGGRKEPALPLRLSRSLPLPLAGSQSAH